MIRLKPLTPIGVGSHRKCYLLPGDDSKCVKVLVKGRPRELREVAREVRYYRHLQSRLSDWSGIPRYWGKVDTDLGEGHVFDAIRDCDGAKTETLAERIQRCESRREAERLVSVVEGLKRYVLDNRILLIDLRPYNILCQRLAGDRIRPVLCDNIGARTPIPWGSWIPPLAKSQFRRRWAEFKALPAMAEFAARWDVSLSD